MRAARIPRQRSLIIGIVLAVLGVGRGWWISAAGGAPLPLDQWWNDVLATTRVPVLENVALAMNWLGGGWFGALAVPIATVLALVLFRRPWWAGYFAAASLVSLLVVQVLKRAVGRTRPEDILVLTDVGSYPSGHVANAATFAVVLCVLFPRLWVRICAVCWVILMAWSRTYLHAHWLSDTVGGAALGVGVGLIMASVFAKFLPPVAPARRPTHGIA